ncbi:MAG: efflux transporter outer membrane subunit [Alphaproteobacteria bacterium]|nr:efflux transporter outer membrane subunit [Alphaproteobacteria bacterium]MDY4689794.1 efflux transporter outer membrane subunit [Alphaproteobacteria bacterium]
MRKLAVLLSFTAAACTVGEDFSRPALYNDSVIKQELALKNGTQPSKSWYALFGDEQLNILIEQGLKNSTDIEQAIAILRQARAELKISQAGFLPQINARGGYNYQKNSKNIGPTADTHYYNAGFDASWELDIWGKGRRQDEAAAAMLKAEEYSLNQVKNVVAAEIASDYVNLKLAVEKLRIAKQNLALQRDIFGVVKSKYQSGLTDDIAYNQAEYLLNSTETQIPQLQSQVEQYKNALAVLSGVLPSQLPLDSEKRSPIFSNAYQYNIKAMYNLPASVIRQRPDVAAAEQNLAAQNALVGAAVADLYPNVSISALWGYAASSGNSLFNSKSQGYSYEPLLSLPLLDWNRLQNQLNKQKYQKQEAFAVYKKTVLTAVGELKNAMANVQNELKRNRLQNRALANMNKVVAASSEKYRSGLIEFSDFLTMEKNRLQAQNSSLESKAGIFQNLIAYYKASGGGYLL